MSLSVAFIIFRMTSYRFLAAVMAAALRRGWRVECWHDMSLLPSQHKSPAYAPDSRLVPAFSYGSVVVREYGSQAQLADFLNQRLADVVVNMFPPPAQMLKRRGADANRSLYVLLEDSPYDPMLNIKSPEELEAIDMYAFTTEHWRDQCIEDAHECFPFPLTADLKRAWREKSAVVGWPQLDELQHIDPEEVRRRWGIPVDKPVVLYFNWPGHIGRPTESFFGATNGKERISYLRSKSRKPGLKQTLASLMAADLRDVCLALREFCDRNDAYLVAKYRAKHEPMSVETAIADKVIFDESYFPSTIMECAAVASLSVGYLTGAVRESVAAGVPHMCVAVKELVYHILKPGSKAACVFREEIKSNGEYCYGDLVRLLTAEEFCANVPHMSLADVAYDSATGEAYFRKFLGIPGGSQSDLFLDALEHLIRTGEVLHYPTRYSPAH